MLFPVVNCITNSYDGSSSVSIVVTVSDLVLRFLVNFLCRGERTRCDCDLLKSFSILFSPYIVYSLSCSSSKGVTKVTLDCSGFSSFNSGSLSLREWNNIRLYHNLENIFLNTLASGPTSLIYGKQRHSFNFFQQFPILSEMSTFYHYFPVCIYEKDVCMIIYQ